jgi:hypothetical protein
LADKALIEPLTIARNGRDRLVLLSVEEYKRLKRRDRRAVVLVVLREGDHPIVRVLPVRTIPLHRRSSPH